MYYPFVKQVLASYQPTSIHLSMDRKPLADGLAQFKPEFWQAGCPLTRHFMPHGMSDYETQSQLITRCQPVLSPQPTSFKSVFILIHN